MPTRSPSSSSGSADVLRHQMERSIDRLAEMARNDVEPAQFFSEVLGCAIQPGGARRAYLWRQSMEGAWQLGGQIPQGVDPGSDWIEHRQQLLTEVSREDNPRHLNSIESTNELDLNGSGSGESHLFSPIRYADRAVGILETTNDVDAAGLLPADTLQFFAALCEIAADFLARNELQQLRKARIEWLRWDQFSNNLWQSIDLASVCAMIANDGRLIVGSDRVCILIRRGRSYRLQSVSSVERVEPRSSATRSLETLAGRAARNGKSVWRGDVATTSIDATDAGLDSILQRHMHDSGVTHIGVLPIVSNPGSKAQSSCLAVVVIEQFRVMEEIAEWKSRAELLGHRVGPVLRAAVERSEIPWLGLWNQIRRSPLSLLRPSTLFCLLLLSGIIAALALVPAELTVTGSAELWPAHRREVFANSSGIVDQILVGHGDDVEQDQPLVVLRDADLESDAPRITGEIATVNERLKGVQAARFVGSNTPDATSRARQLAAEEEELKERLRTLERQHVLFDERRAGLTLRSPIAGKILTWDVDQLLSARPVERGQSLLQVGETSGPWIIEIRVADKNVGHLLRARTSLTPELAVDFVLASEPTRIYHGRIQNVSLTSETDEASHGQVRVIVDFDREQIAQPRAGATAIPRIRCGQKALGYVWLHDLIDAIRTRLLF